MVKHYLASSNTGKKFVCKFDNILDHSKNEFLYIIKGGSGTGKSTLMKRVGRYFEELKEDVEYFYCSSDSNSLDGVRVKNRNIAIVDGTAPHIMETKMIGIKDKNEIKTRVDYVLNSVGMYRYRKRLAGMLSGGERQRVAIARAIVKNPSIIIADEPTGNLDSKNTIEIMNIIKSISKDKLVILVTHEKELANFETPSVTDLIERELNI